MRQAGQALWNFYKNNGAVQDAAETLAFSGLSAGYQALFTDMSPEEIAVSTGLGAAGAFALRPLMARGGYMAGRQADKAFPNAGKDMEGLARMIPGSPQSVEATKGTGLLGEVTKAKYNQNFKKEDGTERGFLEGTFGLIGRNYGDNIAQMGVAIAAPSVLKQMRGEDGRLEEIAKLEQALAELRGELPSAITQ